MASPFALALLAGVGLSVGCVLVWHDNDKGGNSNNSALNKHGSGHGSLRQQQRSQCKHAVTIAVCTFTRIRLRGMCLCVCATCLCVLLLAIVVQVNRDSRRVGIDSFIVYGIGGEWACSKFPSMMELTGELRVVDMVLVPLPFSVRSTGCRHRALRCGSLHVAVRLASDSFHCPPRVEYWESFARHSPFFSPPWKQPPSPGSGMRLAAAALLGNRGIEHCANLGRSSHRYSSQTLRICA